MALSFVTLTGTFDDGSGAPLTGSAVFTPSQSVYAAGIPVVTPDNPVTASIIAGQLKTSAGAALELLATDNAGLTYLTPTGFFTWSVQVTLNSVVQEEWSFFLPSSPSSADLYSLANTGVVSGLYVLKAGDTMSGELDLPDLKVLGLTGATAGYRLAGATASGAPVSGTFAVNDLVLDEGSKTFWLCTVAGTPGTWVQVGATFPVTIAEGGTGETTQQAALDVLAGAVTASKVLAGDGAHVTLRALAAADLPAATTLAQGAVILDGTAADIQPAGVQAAGAKGEAADAEHVHPYQPWQFLPESYGAKGDGKAVADGSITTGLAVLTTPGLAAPAAPTVSNAGTGGTVPAGTYQAVVTYVNQYGETVGSASSSTTTAGTTSTITVNSPPASGDATGWYAYVTQAGGATYTRQQTAGSPTAIGVNLTLTAPPTSSGVNPPAANTTPSNPFTAADVGKYILVAGAGANGRQTLVTTIASYQSAGQVTLAATAAASASGAWFVYGTDDTAAVNAAMAAAYAWWQANNYRQPEIIAPAIYMIAGAPVQGGATRGNAQIPFPVPLLSGPKYEPVITGAPYSPSVMYGLNSDPFITGGTFICARTDGTNNVTYGPASVFGTWTYQQGARSGAMSNLRPVFNGVTVILPYGGTYCGVDLYGATGADLDLAVAAWATPTQMANPNAGDFIGKTWVFGLRTPVLANDGNIKIRNYAFSGLMQGIMLGEHVAADSIIGFFSYYGIMGYSDGTGTPMSHASHVAYACVEACYYQLSYTDANIKIDIDSFDIDTGAGSSGFQIYDPSSLGRGTITVRGLGAVEGKPAVNGGTLLRIISGDQVPGTAGITQPAMPASGTAFRNDFWRDALVTVTSGTVTAITLADSGGANSVALGITSGSFIVPSGKQVTLTYSAAPSWIWYLL